MCSPKDGCSPSGQCGCCTVLVDGKAVVSCNLGAGEDRRHDGDHARRHARRPARAIGVCVRRDRRVAVRVLHAGHPRARRGTAGEEGHRARPRHGRSPSGRASVPVHRLRQDPRRGRSAREGRDARGGPARRCRLERHALPGIRPRTRRQALRRRSSASTACCTARCRLADHARADVVRIDTEAAAAVPGVVRVLTAADVPGKLRVGLIHKDWPVFIPEGGRTSYLGDVLAFVVARDRETARAAAALIGVDYRVLRTITDPVAALDDAEDAVWELDGNVLSRSAYARGDVDAALDASAHVVHEVFQTQRIEHAFLEPESTLVVPGAGGSFTMYSGGQGVWDDRDQVASVLDIEPERITAELVSNGGAFGGKEDMANQAQTALAAFLLDAPVKCTLSREESLLDPPEAAPDPDRPHRGLRRRRQAHRAAGPHGRRLRSVRVGRDEGARTRGRSRERSVSPADHRRGGLRGAHEQFGVRGVSRVRRQPGAVRDGGRPRPPRRACRHQRLGDAQPECHRARRGMGAGSGHG